jgi:hypothetical protein
MATERIEPNKFTQHFFDMDFTPYQNLLQNIKDSEHPASCDLPMVPSHGFDVEILNKIYRHCKTTLFDKFSTIAASENFNEWCYLPKSWGWNELPVKVKNLNIKKNWDDNADTKVEISRKISADEILTSNFVDLFSQTVWESIEQLIVLRLSPGGWVHPHRDTFLEKYKLCHFWMPLHKFEKGIKIFPMGWLKHEVGSMYLFNQGRYPHAIINTSNIDRYVVVGKFNKKTLPTRVVEMFQRNKKKYLEHWI